MLDPVCIFSRPQFADPSVEQGGLEAEQHGRRTAQRDPTGDAASLLSRAYAYKYISIHICIFKYI